MNAFDEAYGTFWHETINELECDGYKEEDIKAVILGNDNARVPLDNFKDVASHTKYNEGYGSAEIPLDLYILMNDNSWYERHEYDGQEWWEHRTPIVVPEKEITITCLKGLRGWQ